MGKGPVGFHECFEVQYIFRRYELNSVCLFENKQYLMQILDLCLITICLFNHIAPQKPPSVSAAAKSQASLQIHKYQILLQFWNYTNICKGCDNAVN